MPVFSFSAGNASVEFGDRKAYDELFRQDLVKKKSAYFYQVAARKKTLGQEPFPSIGIILKPLEVRLFRRK